MGVHLRGNALIEGWRGDKKLLAIYKGDRLIWDGRVSQYLTMPTARASTSAPQVLFGQSAVLEMPALEGWASMTGDGTVAGSSGLTPDTATSDAAAVSPDLVASSILEAPTATGEGAASQSAEAIARQEALLFAPTAQATAAAPTPALSVSSTLDAAVVTSGGETKAATYTVSAALDVPTAIIYPPTAAETPDLSSWHRITATGPAIADTTAIIPTLKAGHIMAAPAVSGSGDAKTPDVEVGASFNRQRMNKSGNFAIGSSGNVPLTGWTSDGTYPATIVDNKLVIQGSGLARITWSVTQNGSGTQSARALFNGVQVGSNFTTFGGGTRVDERVVSAGDEISITVAGVLTSVAAAGTYIDVEPL